jgi:broad specificity phosphatase PhoE
MGDDGTCGHDVITLALARKESAQHSHGMAELSEVMQQKSLKIKAFPHSDECLSTISDPNVKIVHFLRHGQGFHNLMADLAAASGKEWEQFKKHPNNPYTMPEILDAPLTQKGRQQAQSLQSRTQSFTAQPELIVLSPQCRALQTGLIAFEHLLDKEGIPFVAHEMVREETGVHVCDKRRPTSHQKREFPMVDFSLIESEEDKIFLDDRRENKMEIGERIFKFMVWLNSRHEKHIAVASHSGWLMTVFNGVVECDDTLKVWFQTGELRSVKLVFSSE